MTKKVWVITGCTESGDEVPPLVFDRETRPSLEEINNLYKNTLPEEYEDDECDGVHFFINNVIIRE